MPTSRPIEDGEPVRVVAAVIEQSERLLLCRRPAGKRHAGLWEFPGGKMLPGESPIAALRRELAEELGVEVIAVGELLLSRSDPGSAFVVEFYRTEIAGEPTALEHDEIAWVLPSQVSALPLAPSDREAAEHLQA
jgi:8-oxo-dGTP diphosphatase